MSDNRDIVLRTVVDASDAKSGFDETSRAANKMAGEVAQAGIKAGKSLDGIGSGADASAQKLDKSTRSIISSIQRTTATMEAGGRGTKEYYEAIANQRGANADALKPYLAQLDAAIVKQKAASGSLDNMGVSAKQAAFALRGVPAQFTDIFTSLQAGQAPMTVLLQQGGQLKDMFGGVGNAAKAMGGYILGMINPLTIAAATVGTLGYAFYQGGEEARNMAKAIIMTGNAAGTSVNQLREITNAVSASSGATKGAVNEAMNAIINTGGVAAGSLGKVAEAAIKMSKATGESIEDTVKRFSELGKEPVKASEKLNEQYNYLTASVYKQIKALEDQGRATEAAALAQSTFADAAKDMASRVEANLGGLESAWRGVAGAAKWAWDKMLNVGREGSINEQISALKKQLATGSFDFALTEGDIESQIASLEKKLATETATTAEKTKQNELDKSGIAWLKEGDKYLSKKQQMEAEITKTRNLGVAAGASELEINKRIAAVREKFTEKASGGKSQAVKDAESLVSLLDRIHAQDDGEFASSYVKDVQLLVKGWAAGELSLEKYNAEFALLRQQQPGHKAYLKDVIDLERERAKYALDISKQTQDLIEKADAAEYENSKIGATEQQLIALTAARYDEQIALKQEKIAAIEMMEGRNAEVEAIEQQISALRRLQSAEIAKPKLREQAREWEKFSDDINRALTDALMRGFESGKSFGENFVDSLKNSLKTAALKIVVNYVTNGAGQLVGTLGNAAINGVLGTSGSNGGAGTNYLGMANNASTLNTAYGLYQQGWGATAGNMISGAGNLLGSSGIAAYGSGYSAGLSGVSEAIAAYNTAAANAVAAGETSQALIYSNTASSLAAGGSAPGAGAGAGSGASGSGMGASAVGWIAAIAMGMYMSGEAWQNGIRWENYAKDPDAKKYDAEVGIRALHDEPARAIFGDSFVESKLYAVLSGSSLSAQIHGAIKKAVWGGEWEAKGKPLLRGTFSESEQGFTGQEGQKYEKDGGWFKSDSKKTKWKSAREGVDDTLDSVYRTVRNSMVMVGETLGDTSLSGKLKGFSYSTYQKNSSNMGATVNQVSDELAQAMGAILFPSIELLRQNTVEQADALRGDLEQAKRSGNLAVASNIEAQIKNLDSLSNETWSGAFGRILQESQAVNRVFDLMGTNISEVFGSDNANRVLLLSDAIVQMFGGIDALNTSFSAYYANFYSQEEQRAQAMEDMGKAFTSLNLAMPTTREGFKAIVDGLDLATVGGQATFKALMDLQGGFANLVPAIAETAVATEDAAAAARALADAAALLSDRMLSAIDAAQAGITNSARAGMNQLIKAIDLEKQRVNIAREAAAESVASIKGVFDLLTSQVSELYGSVSSTKTSSAAQGSDFISQALATAKASGYLPDQAALSDAINSAKGGLGADQYASQFEADRATLVMAGQLSQLKTISGNQLPVAERALKAAEDQLTALDASLDYYQQQVDALLSIDENTLTLSGSIDAMGKALVEALKLQSGNLSAAILQSLASGQIGSKDASEKLAAAGVKTDELTKIGGYDAFVSSKGAVAAGGKLASNSGWTGSIPEAKAGITAAYNSMSASSFYAAALGEGLSAAMVDALYGFVPGTANKWAAENKLPQFAVGTNYVPKDMVAQIHEGEAIVPKAYNPAAGGGANARLEGLVEALTVEVQRLQAIVNTGNQHASRTANAVNGNPEQPMLVENV